MKKLLLLLSVSASLSSFAQLQPSFGFKAGLASSGMRGGAVGNLNSLVNFSNGMVTTSNHTGFFAGTYASLPLSNVVSLEPGIYYTQKGYDLTGTLDIKGVGFLGANAKAKLNSQYIDVPLLLKANFSGFQVFAGPQVSYLTKADLKTTAGVLGFNILNTKLDATSQFNRWDAAVTGGVGYQMSNGFNVSASYDYGLLKVDAGQRLNSYNRGFKVGVGYSF